MVAYSFKRVFVPAIRLGLGLDPIDPEPGARRPKRQTIRAVGKRRHARPGDELQLYFGMRSSNCMLIGRANCVAVERIIIWFDGKSIQAIMVSGKILGPRQLRRFAVDDGFETLEDMSAFWIKENRPPQKWEGVLIRWEPVR